ncbi:MAG: M23 family metallopeptidase [Patescibacteria group bacterium]
MGNPAPKLSPEELQHNRETVQSIRRRQVDAIQKPKSTKLELLTSDQEPEEEEYVAPEMTLVGSDEDEEGKEDAQNIPEEVQEQQEPIEEPEPAKKVGGTPEEQIQQGQVPEYRSNDVFQPAAAGQQQPGGPAIQPKKSKEDEEKERAKEQVKEMAKDKVKQEAKQVARQAMNAAKKAISQATKAAAKAIAQLASKAVASIAAATAEYWVPILLILIAVVIIIVGAVFLIRALQTPNANGSSPVQAADIIADHELIRTVLSLSSEAEFQKLLDSNKTKLVADIDGFISDLKSKYSSSDSRFNPTIQGLERAKTLIAAYTTPDVAKAAEIRKAIADAVKPWTVDLNPGGMIWPPGKGYRSISNGFRPGSHDGVDVVLPIGTPLYAATDGEIVYVYGGAPNWDAGSDHFRDSKARRDPMNHGFGNMIIVKMDQTIAKANYWEIHHLSASSMYHKVNEVNVSWKVGDKVKQGEIVALSGHNGVSSVEHLHFGTCSEFHGTSCNARGNHQYGVNPKEVLGWQ